MTAEADAPGRPVESRLGEEGDWIVFFGEDWGRHNSTGQYLAAALARSKNVLWVNSLGLRSPRLTPADSMRVLVKLGQYLASRFRRSRGTITGNGDATPAVLVASPIAVPYLRLRSVRRLNRWLVGRYLRRFMDACHVRDPVVVTACPSPVDVIDDLSPVARIYYCADEHSELPGMDTRLVQALETELLGKVDVVLATSRALHAAKSAQHDHVVFFPHGVNYGHMRRALDAGAVPEDLTDVTGRMVGYVGLIGEHLDLPLIQAVADGLPEATLVMIGPVDPAVGPLPSAPNLRYLGRKPYDTLPGYLARFDACILPWNTGARNRFANPTKVREYLAAGCPVVSVPHAEVVGFGEDVRIASDADGFVRALRELLYDAAARPRRVISDAMAPHDWTRRAADLLALVSQLEERAAPPGPRTEAPQPGGARKSG